MVKKRKKDYKTVKCSQHFPFRGYLAAFYPEAKITKIPLQRLGLCIFEISLSIRILNEGFPRNSTNYKDSQNHPLLALVSLHGLYTSWFWGTESKHHAPLYLLRHTANSNSNSISHRQETPIITTDF